jgi:type IV secretory pathway VirB4 component
MSKLHHSSSVFLGETTRGLEQPVFYDTHTPIFNNKPPGCLITGAPGSGKTYLALTLAATSTLMGKTTVVLDYKGDFLSLVNLPELGNFRLWNLADGKRKGIIDPFSMADDPGDKLSLVTTVIELFVGTLLPAELTALSPIVKDVIESPNPSLSLVVSQLRGSESEAAQNLGTRLDIISHMPFAKLAFAPGNRNAQHVDISKGLTVVTLVGMDLPESSDAAKDTNQGRLASGILFLLTDFIRRIMKNDTSQNPKTLIIDEAWAILASQAGARVVKEVALLGRSKSLALILATQNNSHLRHLDIENTITTRFAFQAASNEATDIVKAMRLPEGEGFEEVITDLETGECLMRDFMGRAATVKVSQWKQDWMVAFNNNPYEKAQAARARKREEAGR